MRFSTGITVGVGCISVADVSSFAFAPLQASSSASVARRVSLLSSMTTSSIRTSSKMIITRHEALVRQRVRPRGLARSMSQVEEELWRGEPWDETDETSSQIVTKNMKTSSELDDVMSEVADRGEEPVITPRSAGIEPLPPGRIKPDPIPGMDADDVPGKIEVDLDTLVKQQKDLEQVARVLRRERLDQEREEGKFFGWTVTAEKWNGRSAMVGVAAGFFIEAVTGQSFPQQVEGIAQTLGLLPLDYETYFQ